MVRYTTLKGFYELEKTIGIGGFAKVKLGKHIATGCEVAVKIMEKSALGEDLPRVKIEVEALKTLQHKNICQLFQTIETDTHYFMIMEYCSGGELFDHIVEKNRLTERESRSFFRQIVSAVAYLHSLGYAHRDLKPENVLLDHHQNLKLIDFGLCAKPKGGIKAHLYTSCGSPTYAAPELILGKKYLGSEVDIWSMGVLLYALLCGFLPFDDNNISNLYSKILVGKYDEPSWLSSSSKQLIRAMLQTDPKKRITIAELCNHPWMITGFFQPVSFLRRRTLEKDNEVLQVMSTACGDSVENLWTKISKNDRNNYNTATYLLLLSRKQKGLTISMPQVYKSQFKTNRENVPTNPSIEVKTFVTQLDESPSHKTRRIVAKIPDEVEVKPQKKIDSNKVTQENSEENQTVGRKRLRNEEIDNVSSPIPVKKTTDHQKHENPLTPPAKQPKIQCSTPGSARKVLMGLERGLNKMRDVLTPKRRFKSEDNHNHSDQPVILSGKGLCNVSSTSSDCPKFVLSQLRRALHRKGIICRQKGFILQGETESTDDEGSKEKPISSKKICSFELEVCLLEGITEEKTIVGIRRKRLKGDSWIYKKVCEEVLALAAEQSPSSSDQSAEKCLI